MPKWDVTIRINLYLVIPLITCMQEFFVKVTWEDKEVILSPKKAGIFMYELEMKGIDSDFFLID